MQRHNLLGEENKRNTNCNHKTIINTTFKETLQYVQSQSL